MQRTSMFLVLAVVAGVFAGCAEVRVMSLEDAKREAGHGPVLGAPFARMHPYLLVGMQPTDDPNQPQYMTRLIYLPEDPYVARVKPGWGTANGTIKVDESGALKELGAASDSKIPETIKEITGLIPAIQGALAPQGIRSGQPLPTGLYRIEYNGDHQVVGVRHIPLN